MRSSIFKQVLFLIVLAVVIVLLMGIVVKKNANSQTVLNLKKFSRAGITGWYEDEDSWDTYDPTSWNFRYNRVEGLYGGYSIKRDYWIKKHPDRAFIYGFTGYASGPKEVEYQLGLEKGFSKRFRFGIGGEYHRMVDTPDRWIMPDLENSLAAFLLKEDFHDYYLREGGSVYITQNITYSANFTLTYQYDNLDSLKKSVDWSLFGGDKHFRDNPLMSAGELNALKAKLVIDTRTDKDLSSQGWYIKIEGTKAGGNSGGDYNFDHLVFDLRRYQPLGYNESLNFRIRVGTANGILPWQYRFYLGGVSTLRGFPYKSLPGGAMSPGGNRMFLAQLEYSLGEDTFPDEIDLGFLDLFNVIVFTDLGWVADVDPDLGLFKGFDSMSGSNIKNDIGIALANSDGTVRIEIARRTDTGRKPFNILFRINKSF